VTLVEASFQGAWASLAPFPGEHTVQVQYGWAGETRRVVADCGETIKIGVATRLYCSRSVALEFAGMWNPGVAAETEETEHEIVYWSRLGAGKSQHTVQSCAED
jgi:hypothetical protein